MVGYVRRQKRARATSYLSIFSPSFRFSDYHETFRDLSEVPMRGKAKEDYKPEKNGPGLTRSTSTASTCVRLYNISNQNARLKVSYFISLELFTEAERSRAFPKCTLFLYFSTREKRIVVAKTLYPRFASYCEYRISSYYMNVNI